MRRAVVILAPGSALCLAALTIGCNAVRNGWLDPTALGNFDQSASMAIRTSLSLEDTPQGIPGSSFPTPEDRIVKQVEYPIMSGDTLAIEIYELRHRDLPFQAQAVVSSAGYVNLPVVGKVDAAWRTAPEFERALVDALRVQGILLNPEVTVNPVFLQAATYSIFGIGVSAANNAPLRAGTFPIRRPDLRVLEAINQVGGLSEFVTEVYVFRYDDPTWNAMRNPPSEKQAPEKVEPPRDPDEPADPPLPRPGSQGEPSAAPTDAPEKTTDDSAREALLDAVEGRNAGRQPQATPTDVPAELEPGLTDPFVWIDGEFVRNPAYVGEAAGSTTAAPPGSIGTVAPAIDWARLTGEASYRIIRIPAEVLRSGDPAADIVVRAGDVIRIVSGEIGEYYVMGQVNRVGAFRFNAEPIRLKAAIAAAGGLSTLAWPSRCTVYRRLGQREQMIQVDLDRIFAGQDEDFFIKRGDIINVGTHPFAPFLRSLRDFTIPNPVSNVGYSFTYARNFADIDSFVGQTNPRNARARDTRFRNLFQPVFNRALPALFVP